MEDTGQNGEGWLDIWGISNSSVSLLGMLRFSKGNTNVKGQLPEGRTGSPDRATELLITGQRPKATMLPIPLSAPGKGGD